MSVRLGSVDKKGAVSKVNLNLKVRTHTTRVLQAQIIKITYKGRELGSTAIPSWMECPSIAGFNKPYVTGTQASTPIQTTRSQLASLR